MGTVKNTTNGMVLLKRKTGEGRVCRHRDEGKTNKTKGFVRFQKEGWEKKKMARGSGTGTLHPRHQKREAEREEKVSTKEGEGPGPSTT